MSVSVFIPSPLRQFTGGAHLVPAAGGTVQAVLAGVVAAHPQLADNLFAAGGRLQPFVHVFVNGKDVHSQQGLATVVADGAEILIVQAISGG